MHLNVIAIFTSGFYYKTFDNDSSINKHGFEGRIPFSNGSVGLKIKHSD